jgi:hypothetical protein
MHAASIQSALDQLFDQALIFHGFTDYVRDYELVVYEKTAVRPPRLLRCVFKYCVEARVGTPGPEFWKVSLADHLLQFPHEPTQGFVWGVKYQELYPGGRVNAESDLARRWSEAVGVEFHEVLIETNCQKITLVASDAEVTEVNEGYAPFTATL